MNDRLRLVIEAALPKVGPAMGEQLRQLLDPRALAIAAGIVTIWAALQFTGVGELADVALLVIGWTALGAAAWQGCRELIAFAIDLKGARTDQDIDRAAGHLAKAISLLGVQGTLALLLHARPKVFELPPSHPARQWYGRWNLGSPPLGPPGRWSYEPSIKRVPQEELPGSNIMGETSAWGDIRISSALSEEDARATLLHEKVHSILTPKLYFLRNLRTQIALQGYERSVLLRYLEEALAETYAALKTNGLDFNAFVRAITFPGSQYDITVAAARAEGTGILLGPINVGGMTWLVWANRQ